MSVANITLSRQSGLLAEMRSIANNIANQSTSGFRREGVVFSEFITTGPDQRYSISMVATRARNIDLSQGPLSQTASQLDLAIEGNGFFQVENAETGETFLTRAGRFARDADGSIVTPDGLRLLSADGGPLLLPPDGSNVAISGDGTISTLDGAIGQIGLVRPADPTGLTRHPGALFAAPAGVEPEEDGEIVQGYIEGANIDPVVEIARMIEVQRAYEFGQAFIDRESDRKDDLIRTLTS